MRFHCRLGASAAAFGLAVLGLAGSAQAQDAKSAGTTSNVTVSSPWARATPGGAKVGAAYLTLDAKAADKLVAARSPVAGAVELHTHTHEGGVMRMRRIEAIPAAPGSTVKLEPGGHHIMLMDLKQPLKEGEAIELTLVFEAAGEMTVKVPVLKVGSPGPGEGGKAGHGGHGGHGKH
jgi:hypothetical protein